MNNVNFHTYQINLVRGKRYVQSGAEILCTEWGGRVCIQGIVARFEGDKVRGNGDRIVDKEAIKCLIPDNLIKT